MFTVHATYLKLLAVQNQYSVDEKGNCKLEIQKHMTFSWRLIHYLTFSALSMQTAVKSEAFRNIVYLLKAAFVA